MRSTRTTRLIATLAALALTAGPLSAQRPWFDDQGRDAFKLDFAMPFLKGDGHKFFSGTFVPAASLRVGEGIRFEADLPVMRAGQDFGGTTGTQSSFRLGNPYIGLRIGDDTKPVSGTIGVRAPIGQNPKDAIGQQAVLTGVASTLEDYEAYSPNVMLIRSYLEVHRVNAKGLLFGVRGGPSLQINTSGDPQRDTETNFDYGARIGVEKAGGQLALALMGRYLITASQGADFASRSSHDLAASGEIRRGAVRPRLSLTVPLDKARRQDVAGAVLGLGVSIAR